MIVLDTNVLSELMSEAPASAVVGWLDRKAPESVWTTSVTLFEIDFGAKLLPDGRRKRELSERFEELVDSLLGRRVLDFDRTAARAAASIAASLQSGGRPGDLADLQIAGIVRARKAMLATRNTKHFDGVGIELANPWKDR